METPEHSGIGQEMYDLIARLYPVCRSITGEGVRATLGVLQEHIPLEIREVSSGTEVFDWTVPQEWNIQGAYVDGPDGNRVLDFEDSNLHVVGYSSPVRERLSLEELKQHLHTDPNHPDWIPYRTSYYRKDWGFCMSHNQFIDLPEGTYEAVIDSSLQDGHLTYGEYVVRGQTDAEVLISTHICHPSLANDNLSGIALAAFLAKHVTELSPRYTYRFLFTPGTIGSITWLSQNEAGVSRIKHGIILACVGDSGRVTYKKSRRGDAEIDRVVSYVLKRSGKDHSIVDFSPYGYDERQFCSPGFNLPVGCLMRTPHGEFPEYHTSADDLRLVKKGSLADSFSTCLRVLRLLEGNRIYVNQNPKCEPQLGKRGLYRTTGGSESRDSDLAMFWLLNLSDGHHCLLDVAEKSNLEFDVLQQAALNLEEKSLLAEAS